MAQQKEGGRQTVPRFANEQEAAAFWDTHSPLDYPEEFHEVEVKFGHPLIKKGLTVKLNDTTLAALTEKAHAKGIGRSTLVRMWILEHLQNEADASS